MMTIVVLMVDINVAISQAPSAWLSDSFSRKCRRGRKFRSSWERDAFFFALNQTLAWAERARKAENRLIWIFPFSRRIAPPPEKKAGRWIFSSQCGVFSIRRLSKQINFPFLPSGWDLLLLQSWPCFILSCVTPRLRAERVEIIHTLYWPRGWQLVGGNSYWWVPVVVNLLTCLCDRS